LGVKRPGREADHSPPSRAEVKEWVELHIHSPIRLHGVVLSWSTRITSPFYQGVMMTHAQRTGMVSNAIHAICELHPHLLQFSCNWRGSNPGGMTTACLRQWIQVSTPHTFSKYGPMDVLRSSVCHIRA
jgi:hypothetical protein